jgi:Protein of unknown function (DUF3732)
VDIPRADELSVTTNITTIIERLKSLVGINLNIHEPPEGQTRDPLTTTLRHALAFAFQDQNEISQRKFLFHGQGDPQKGSYVTQSIKDTLPYFFGVVDDDYVQGKTRVKELRRYLRERERMLARLEAIANGGIAETASLLTEGRNVGILDFNEVPESWDIAISVLRAAVSASAEEQLIRYEESTDQAELLRLNGVYTELRQQLNRYQDDLDGMRKLLSDKSGFARETREQVSRLTSLRLFTEAAEPCCPLCNQSTSDLPSSGVLEAEMQRALKQLEQVARNTPGLEALIIEQEQRIASTKRLLQQNRTEREALRNADDRLMELRDEASRRAYVLGRISLFLETLPQIADSSELQTEIFNLQREIEQLEADLSDENIQERLDSVLAVISRDITTWAERLELEHQGNPFRLDLRSLQVLADTGIGPIRMEHMGSGANWLGCHLMAHFALHLWFVRKMRPVPRFLFLDQPSQVYFPADRDVESSLANLDNKDRLAVIRMFELIRDVVNELQPNFQVIITEHADISEDWYQEAVVERWRNGNTLIPIEWLTSVP